MLLRAVGARIAIGICGGRALARLKAKENDMQYTLTLSRWHKVAERMNAALRERETDVKAAFTATTISPWNKEG